MAQTFIYEWLKMQRLTGNDSFFSIRYIAKSLASYGLPSQTRDVHRQINKLYAGGYLEVKIKSKEVFNFYKRRCFRIKKEYILNGTCFNDCVMEYKAGIKP